MPSPSHLWCAPLFLRRGGKNFPPRSVGDFRRPHIGAAFWLAMAGQMLEGGENLAGAERQSIALQAFHRGHAHLAYQVGVLAEGLFDPAPTWIARHVHYGRENLDDAAGANLARGPGVDARDNVGTPA